MDIFQLLTQQAQHYGDKPALIFKETTLSFSQLRNQSLVIAKGLKQWGLKKGSCLGIYLPNCPHYVLSYLAGFCSGATIIPLDFQLKADEIQSCFSHSQTEYVIYSPRPDLNWGEIKKSLPHVKKWISIDAKHAEPGDLIWESFQDEGDFYPVSVDDHDPALIMYTSGTTGTPKGILLNYRHLDGSPEAMHHFVDLSDRDIKLCPIPLSHIGGFVYIQNCLVFGITLILMERFHPLDFLRYIEQYRVTCFHIVPAMYTAILTLKHIEKFDLSSLRWVVVFGAPSSPEILERFHRFCPNAKLLNGWGMTETCPPNTVTPLSEPKIESVGKPAPNCEIAIVDDDDTLLPQGQVGEIVIRGWVVMQEYYKDPQLTAQSKRNGWFHTGDLGRFDEQGFLYIVGRKKEMIKVGGQIVFAPEVESALYKHEEIAEVAVLGVPDLLRGETIMACVVLREGSQLNAEDIRYFAREHLAHFKVPSSVEIYKELPKNRTGKIDKEQLKGSLCPKNT